MIIPIIEPILNPIWVLLLLGEKPGLPAIAGGIIILSAITLRSIAPMLLASAGARRSAPKPSAPRIPKS
jgi:drug/metabolite transporter (DMT)-like permease